MTALNRIIREIKYGGATEVFIRSNEVRTIAEHCRLTMYNHAMSTDEFEKMIRAGEMRCLGVPVKVLGNTA